MVLDKLKFNKPEIGIPGIQQTGYQVSLRGLQASRQDLANLQGFANLSKSLQGITQSAVKIQDLEQKQQDVLDSYKSEISSIKGLTEQGVISEDQFEQFLLEQQGELQRRGIINAYENFMRQEEIDKERANIRLTAYNIETQKLLPQLTNPDPKFRLTKEQAHSKVLERLNNQENIGTDSNTNPVSFVVEDMSSGELIALTRGFSNIKLQLESEIQEKTHERAIEGASNNFQVNMFQVFTTALNTGVLPDTSDIISKAYNFGVPNINEHILSTLESVSETWQDSSVLSPTSRLQFYSLLDEVESTLVLREDESGNQILFAAPGTENFNKVEQIRDSFDIAWAKRERALESEDERKERILTTHMLERVAELSVDGSISEEQEKNLSRELITLANGMGYLDPDKILGKMDTTMRTLVQEPDTSVEFSKFLRTIDANYYSSEGVLHEIENEIYDSYTEGNLSIDDFKALRSAIRPAINKSRDDDPNSTSNMMRAVEKEGGYGFAGLDTKINTTMKEVLKMNDTRIQDRFGDWITMGARDNAPLATYSLPVEELTLEWRQFAEKGGTITLPEFDSSIKEKLPKSIPEVFINDVLANSGKSITLETPTSTEDVRANSKKVHRFMEYYSSYQALQQMIALEEQKDEHISENSSEIGEIKGW